MPILGEWESITRASSGEFLGVHCELRQEGGLKAENFSDGTHFWGRLDHNGDDLIHFSVGSTSFFELTPERIPDSPTGRYVSAPPADAYGSIAGWHAEHSFPFHADDKRCNVYRVFRHALHQHVNAQWRQLGETYRNADIIKADIIKMENSDEQFRQVRLEGWLPSPELRVGLVDRRVSVWAQVEIRIDVELEGWSWILISDNPSSGIVVRACGWFAQPV
jgi:hypothetical protein